MISSILIGFSHSLLIFLGGWLRVLFSFISIRFGNGIPTFYIILGLGFGIGDYYLNEFSYWGVFLSGIISSFLITMWTSNYDIKNGNQNSTVTNCGVGFQIGSIIGMLIGLI